MVSGVGPVRHCWVLRVGAAMAALCPVLGAGAARVPGLAHAGAWDIMRQVPGSVAVSPAALVSVSCASVGNCSAGGYGYRGRAAEPLVVVEKNGIWGSAQVVAPGGLPAPVQAVTTSVSCAAPGSCAAGGYYQTVSNSYAFVVSENHGTWDRAERVPGLAGGK